jgi:hypothetical protein
MLKKPKYRWTGKAGTQRRAHDFPSFSNSMSNLALPDAPFKRNSDSIAATFSRLRSISAPGALP